MADEIIGSIGVTFEGDYSGLTDDFATAVQMASDAGQKMADALNTAFSTVSLAIPAGSITMGSIAADLAQEIAQAFANTPISLNLNTTTASSAAAAVAQEIAGAFQNTPINLNIAPVDDSAAVTAAQEIAGAFGEISIPAPNTDQFIAGLDGLKGPLADVSGTTIDWTGVLDTLNKSLDDVGGSAGDQAASISALEAGMSAAEEAAQSYAGSAEDIRQKQQDADDALADARTALEDIIDAYGRGEAGENELATATANVESAFRAANPAIQESGQDAEEASGKLGTMGEQLLALGEALAITEGLKEFGSEALTAADNVTRTTIALTALTGDGDAAKETIEKLEALGISDGLAFPSLLQAGQRMEAMLGDAANIPDELAKIANAAQAMGTDIGSAASMFDRMASSGAANARSMIALGLNLGDLATAMGVTSDEAAKAFKALDVSDRIEVLNTALGKFSGIAQDVAQNTFTGAWTVLANQWDSVMVSIGKDIMPVVTGLLSLISTDVLPFVKSLADDFAALPTPVKDVAVGIGLAAAAVVPLVAGLAGLALAFKGVTEAGELITGFLTTIGVLTPEVAAETSVLAAAQEALAASAGTAVEGEQGLAIAEGEAGAAAAESGSAVAGFAAETSGAASIAGSLTLGVGVLAAAFGGLALNVGGSARTVADFFNTAGVNVGDVLLGWATGANTADIAFKSVTDSQKILADEASSDAAAHDKLTGSMKEAGQATGDLFDKMLSAQELLEQMDEAYKVGAATANDLVWALQNLNAAQDKWNASMREDSGVQAVSDQYNKLNDAVIQAKTTLEILQVDDDGTAASHARLAIAANDVTKAQQALNSALGDAGDSLKAYTALADSANSIIDKLPDTYAAYVQKVDDGGTTAVNSIKAIQNEIDKLSEKMDSMPQHAAQLQSLIDNLETARAKAHQFADEDEFTKIGTEISNLDAKVNGIKPDLLDLFNSVLSDLDQIPGSVAKNGQELIKWLQQAQTESDKLDQQQQKAQKTFDTAWLKYVDTTQNQAIPITATLAQRLGDVDSTFQSTDTHVSDAANSLANYIGAVGRLKIGYDGLSDSQHQVIGDFDTITSNANSSWQMVDDAFTKASGAFKTLAQTDLPAVIKAEQDHTQALIDKGAPYAAVIKAITDEDASVKILAQTDIPAAISAEKSHIDKLKEYGAPIQDIAAGYQEIDKWRLQLDQDEITAADHENRSASQWIIDIDNIKQHNQDAANSIQNVWGNVYTDFQKGWNDAWTKLGSSLTDGITGAKSWHDAWMGFLGDIEKEILNNLIGTVFKGLESELDKTITSLIPSLGSAFTSTATTAISGTFTPAMTAASNAAQTAAVNMATMGSQATTAAGSATSGIAGVGSAATSAIGSFASLAGAIGSVVGAVAGIAGDIMQAHANNLLGEIEVNTRSAFNQITNIWETQKSNYETNFQRFGDIWNTEKEGFGNVYAALSSMGQTLVAISGGIGGISGAGNNADKLDQIWTELDQIRVELANSTTTSALTGKAQTDLDIIAQDSNLIVQGIVNLALDIQAIRGVSAAAATQSKTDFQNLFTQTAAQAAATAELAKAQADLAAAQQSGNQQAITAAENQLKAAQDALAVANQQKDAQDSTTTAVNTTGGNTVTAVGNNATTVTSAVFSGRDMVSARVDAAHTDIVSHTDTSASTVSAAVRDGRDAVKSAVDANAQTVGSRVDAVRTDIVNHTDANASTVSAAVRDGRDVIKAAVDMTTAATTTATSHTDAVGSSVDRMGRDVVTAVSAAASTISSHVDSTTSSVERMGRTVQTVATSTQTTADSTQSSAATNQTTATNTTVIASNTGATGAVSTAVSAAATTISTSVTPTLAQRLEAALASGDSALAAQILNSMTGTASTTAAVTSLPSAIGSAVGAAVSQLGIGGPSGNPAGPQMVWTNTGSGFAPIPLPQAPSNFANSSYGQSGWTWADLYAQQKSAAPSSYTFSAAQAPVTASQAAVGTGQAQQLDYSYPVNVVPVGGGVGVVVANPDGTFSTIVDWKDSPPLSASGHFVAPPANIWSAMMTAAGVGTADAQMQSNFAAIVAQAVANAAATGTGYTPPNAQGQGGGPNAPNGAGTSGAVSAAPSAIALPAAWATMNAAPTSVAQIPAQIAQLQVMLDTATQALGVAIRSGNLDQIAVAQDNLLTAQEALARAEEVAANTGATAAATTTMATAVLSNPAPTTSALPNAWATTGQPPTASASPYPLLSNASDLLKVGYTASQLRQLETSAEYLSKMMSLPSFDVGGYVPRDMVAQLHAGETVIPPGGSGGGNISVTIQVIGATNPEDVASRVMAKLKRVSPRFAMASS